MEEMISIGNKICSKEYGYPYAVLDEDEIWYLYDHIKNSATYVKVKEIWRGTTEQDLENVKKALIKWGWTNTGFEPDSFGNYEIAEVLEGEEEEEEE